MGAYYRLRPDVNDYHAALNEAGVLCVSAHVHNGWMSARGGRIAYDPDRLGGHAFAIVGYDENGFWVQNSWGTGWGEGGYAHWSYEDWAANVMDAWVFRLAIPSPKAFAARGRMAGGDVTSGDSSAVQAPRRSDIAGHFLHVDDGKFHVGGNYHSSANDVRETAQRLAGRVDAYPHLLLYAHGGLNAPKASASRIKAMKDIFKENGIYPFHFMYDTGLGEELKDLIFGRAKGEDGRASGFTDWTDRLIEKSTRKLGTLIWEEMKRDARTAFEKREAGYQTLQIFGEALAGKNIKVHLVGHSTGAILHGHLLSALDKIETWKLPISSCSLFAPAATVDFFEKHYRPRLGQADTASFVGLPHLMNYCLTDTLERDDTVTPLYRKSLLYLVSNAFEREPEKPVFGMQKFNGSIDDAGLTTHYTKTGGGSKTRSRTHGGFDNDVTTMNELLRTVLGKKPKRAFNEDDLDY